MDWLTKMNRALDYIEENLTEELDMVTIAAKACCSSYNFQRMFSFITDCPLAEYIRRRRLTLRRTPFFRRKNSDGRIPPLLFKPCIKGFTTNGYRQQIMSGQRGQVLKCTAGAPTRDILSFGSRSPGNKRVFVGAGFHAGPIHACSHRESGGHGNPPLQKLKRSPDNRFPKLR